MSLTHSPYPGWCLDWRQRPQTLRLREGKGSKSCFAVRPYQQPTDSASTRLVCDSGKNLPDRRSKPSLTDPPYRFCYLQAIVSAPYSSQSITRWSPEEATSLAQSRSRPLPETFYLSQATS